MQRYEITDKQFRAVEALLPGRQELPGKTADNRLFLNACVWILRFGAPWRDLPERFGDFNSVFQRDNRWCKSGLWQKILEVLNQHADPEEVLIDTTIVRAHQHAAGAKKKRTKSPTKP